MIGGPDSLSQPDHAAPVFWTKQRLEIAEWLTNQAPPLAETYSGIVELLFGSTIPWRGRFIAHGVREIGNNLVRYVASSDEGRVQYEQLTSSILEEWRLHGLPVGDEPPPVSLDASAVSDAVPVPREIVTRIARFLGEHEAGVVRARQKFQTLYAALNAEQPSSETLGPVIQRWSKVCRWFLQHVHDNGEMDAQVLTQEFRSQFQAFEALLHAIIAPFFAVMDDIDEIVAEANR